MTKSGVERDALGRFLPGSTANKNGRPPKQRELRYYEITMTACTFKDWEEIVKMAVKQAKRGDSSARTWLSNYLVGVPEQYFDHSGRLEVVIEHITAPQTQD